MSPLRYWGITLVLWLGVSTALSLTPAPALPCTRILLSPGYIQCKSSLMFTREVVVWKTALGCPSLIDEDPAHMGDPSLLPVLWPHLLALGHGTHLGPGGRLSTARHYHKPTPPEEEEMETGSSPPTALCLLGTYSRMAWCDSSRSWPVAEVTGSRSQHGSL